MQIDAVIFDMDGLMLDTEPIYRRASQAAAKECGFEISDDHYARLIGRDTRGVEAVFRELYGSQFPLEQYNARYAEHRERCFTETSAQTKPGLPELLSFLEARNLPKAVATSTHRERAIPRLEAAGLLCRFITIVTSDEVERGKPAPDLFLLAARKINTPPHRCLVLEDSEPGVQGAHAAGMHVIMVPDLVSPRDEIRRVARICSTLFEVQAALHGSLSLPDVRTGDKDKGRLET